MITKYQVEVGLYLGDKTPKTDVRIFEVEGKRYNTRITTQRVPGTFLSEFDTVSHLEAAQDLASLLIRHRIVNDAEIFTITVEQES